MTASGRGRELAERLLGAQAVYYLGTGLWSVCHRRSFEAVSGPKRDYWLVRTVGALAAVIGASLAAAARDAPENGVLTVGSAAAFGAVDVAYAAPGRISRVYLVDAAVQLAFLAAFAGRKRAGRRNVYDAEGTG